MHMLGCHSSAAVLGVSVPPWAVPLLAQPVPSWLFPEHFYAAIRRSQHEAAVGVLFFSSVQVPGGTQ